MGAHIAREHIPLDDVPRQTDRELWAYVLGELDFLIGPDQKRVPAAVSAAMHELHRRSRRRHRK